MRLKIQLTTSLPTLSGEEEAPLVHRSRAVDQRRGFLVLAAFCFIPLLRQRARVKPLGSPSESWIWERGPRGAFRAHHCLLGRFVLAHRARGGTGRGVCRLWDRKHKLQVERAEFLPLRWKLWIPHLPGACRWKQQTFSVIIS